MTFARMIRVKIHPSVTFANLISLRLKNLNLKKNAANLMEPKETL
jgi:hypothetical protein